MAGVFDTKGILPTDPNDIRSMALLNALKQQEQAGITRTASPLGAIAQNLIPLFGALVQARALQQNQGLDPLEQAKLEQTQAQTELAKARTAKTQAGPSTLEGLLAQRAQTGGDTSQIMDLIKQKQAQNYSGQKALYDSLQEQLGRPPTATEFNQASLGQKILYAQQLGQAMIPARVEQATQEAEAKAQILGKPNAEQINSISMRLGSIKSLDRAIAGMDQTTGKDILLSKVTGGILSTPALRDYAKTFNDVDNARAGARGMTKAALDRIRQELPDPLMATQDPASFVSALRQARSNLYEDLATHAKATGEAVRLPPELTKQVADLAPKKKPSVEIDMNDPNLQRAFEAIQKKFPKMGAEEMANYYETYGVPK